MSGNPCRFKRSMQHHLSSRSDNTSPGKRTYLALPDKNPARVAFWVI
jgi:hypothetical protein